MKKFSIVKHAKIFFSLTAIVLIVGIVSMFTRGFNLGIDFTGGSIIDLKFAQPVSTSQVRTVLDDHDLGSSIIQLGTNGQNTETSESVLIRTGLISDSQRKAVMDDLTAKLGENQVLKVENVGATVGNDLVKQAIGAVVLSWVLMIAYITFRFELRFALAAIIALIIDVMVTLSYFSLLHLEIDSSFVAALLTVVGYSVNGTIVIFDRIRENLHTHRRNESMEDMVDNSIWQTMTRSIYTTLTTLFAVVAIFLFGGETIHNFSFAMLVGFSSGFYTSTFLSGTMWLFLRKKLKKAA
ncbi:protein translocase subunit SecF [Acidaminococcus sp. NSJ-142]|jgi:preprotein translocase subunit SecF|uniref:protein translocase subunit SecF n=1 Tax=Acidaminococcus TaxID=904 RepID=UPI000CF8D551|nr:MULTISPECIES: protein translocase subunit SecF [Acidaminococcus]MCD2434835.1 protein translocase subunit SecF [Acidaminococcus hominis]MCH4095922.1 protein translocase subunit SecF [Acidaminococcus provencensis]RHK02373.1 protein translocase subunit SecF [Acidaminococcus sp. AM05-11]